MVASAFPFNTAKSTGDCGFPSMMNVTVPIGVPEPEAGVTIAVNVTACPTVAGLGVTSSCVFVATRAALTVAVSDAVKALLLRDVTLTETVPVPKADRFA